MGFFNKREEKPKEVKPSKQLASTMVDMMENPEAVSAIKTTKETAQKVFDALGGTRNVRYDVSQYNDKDGNPRISASVQVNGYDGKDKPSQTLKLSVSLSDTEKAKVGNITYAKVSTYDGSFKDVAFKDEYESITSAREKLENAGLMKPFVTAQKEASPRTGAYALRSSLYDAIEKANNETGKVINAEGRAVNDYFASSVTESLGEDGTKYAQFSVSNHQSQSVEFRFVNDELTKVSFKDFSHAEKGNKDSVETIECYNKDFLDNALERMDGLDENLKGIVKSVDLNFRPYEKPEKTAEAEDVPFEEEAER